MGVTIVIMKFIYNNPILKERRQDLRRNQTEAEKSFWSCVRHRKLEGKRFFRQYSLGPYILDFYCPALRLVVEIDGGHHLEPDNHEYDETRTEYLKDHGIEVVRFSNSEVLTDMCGILGKLKKVILQRQ